MGVCNKGIPIFPFALLLFFYIIVHKRLRGGLYYGE
jgi:hypothetical protein